MRRLLLVIALLVLASQSGRARADSARSIEAVEMTRELIDLFNGRADPAHVFTPGFLAQIPASKVRSIAAGLVGQLGPATAAKPLEAPGPTGSTLLITFEHGAATVRIVMETATAGRIAGLKVTGVDDGRAASLRTLDEIAAAITALPGRTGLAVADLEPSSQILSSQEPDRALAIGSAFKLVVLAKLVRAIDSGARRWDDTLVLDGGELPAGEFRGKPKGTTIPLRHAAELMIRISDNSATDLLMKVLGRYRVETMQSRIGIGAPSANRPFLTTMEAFKPKRAGRGRLGRRYLALDENGRRRLLDSEVARKPSSEIAADDTSSADDTPAEIAHIEWFATPADLVRIMAWFRDHGRTPAGAEALRILALNPGVSPAVAERFSYIGYKGGSEPGVISTTLLLQTRARHWRAVTATWNNDQQPVNELKFVRLVDRAAWLVADDNR